MKQVKDDPMPDPIQKGPSIGPIDVFFIILMSTLLVIALLLTSCAPDLQAKQTDAKRQGNHKKEKPVNNYLPLIGIGCLSMWVIDRMQGEN